MDIDLIKTACKKYIGLHDFRNFCKKDESAKFGLEAALDDQEAQQNFMRRMYSFQIVEVSENKYNKEFNVCMAIIKGSAFLWHQVRCMMGVLFLIGSKTESSDVIDKLLQPGLILDRPNYDIADGANLILSDCGFEGLQWKNNTYTELETYKVFKNQFNQSLIETQL